jgi:hypothetical protein
MVKSHGRKAAAKKLAAQAGIGHQAAAEELKQRTSDAPAVDLSRMRLVAYTPEYTVCDLPHPDLGGAEPYPTCEDSGDGEDAYEMPNDTGRPPLLVSVVCPACLGCGRADHDQCPPVHATDDPFEVDEWLAEQDREAWQETGEEPDRCPSCADRRYNYLQSHGEKTEEAEAAETELQRRAKARGLTEQHIAGAALFGELDQVLGDGAQALAGAADTTFYLRVPCGCAEDLCQVIVGDLVKVAQ